MEFGGYEIVVAFAKYWPSVVTAKMDQEVQRWQTRGAHMRC